MRIHTSNDVTYSTIFDAAKFAGVGIDVDNHASRTHDTAWEIKLTGSSSRRPNNRGAWRESDDHAATWDEWGMVLGYIFWIDPAARVGSVTRPAYADATDFEFKTDYRFAANIKPDDLHGDHTWDLVAPGERECRNCSAVHRWE